MDATPTKLLYQHSRVDKKLGQRLRLTLMFAPSCCSALLCVADLRVAVFYFMATLTIDTISISGIGVPQHDCQVAVYLFTADASTRASLESSSTTAEWPLRAAERIA
jgi:hypothetical protein